MRKIIISVLFACLFLPSVSLAEIKEGSIEINPFAGLHVFEDSKHFERRGVYGLRLGYNITRSVGIEGAFDYVGPRARMLHADLLYHFTPEKRFTPFVAAGVGGAHLSPREKSSYNTLMGNFGFGFKYSLSDHIAFRADARDVITNMQNVSVTAGLVFTFGGKSPKAVPEPAPTPAPVPAPPPPAPKPKPEPAPAPPAPKAEVAPAPAPPPPPVMRYEPVKIILEDIHFDFDKATLTSVAKEILKRNVQLIKRNPGIQVQIEGHACAHGTDEYNMALSERRANAVKEFLVKDGISPDRLTTISYGETRLAMPEIPTPKNKYSTEAKANRRVHFEVLVK